MDEWLIVDQLDQADLPAAIYRTARRLLDRTDPGQGYVRISYEEIAAICDTESQQTVRGHLSTLARIGVISYKRNSAVHVMWHVGRAPDARDARATRAESVTETTERAPDARNARATRAESVTETTERAPDARDARGTRETRAGRAKRAVDDHPIGRIGRKVGSDPTEPTYLPEGGMGETASRNAEQQRVFALLTDAEIGLDAATAAQLATRYTVEDVRAQVFRFCRDRAAGVVRSPAIITARLRRGYAAGPILESDRASPLWQRHTDAQETEAELRRRYIPDEYAEIINRRDEDE